MDFAIDDLPDLHEVLDGLRAQGPAVPVLFARRVHSLEDRAAVLFWRKLEADRSRRVDPLRRMSTESFCRDYDRRLGDSSHSHLSDALVTDVRARGIRRGSEFDTALVEVFHKGIDRARRKRARELFVLVRKAGVRSPDGFEVSSAHCPKCGAPDDGSGGHGCTFCGVILNDGSRDWVLADLHEARSPRAGLLLRNLRAR